MGGGGLMKSLDLGMEDYPCMQKHKITHSGWAWEQAILTLIRTYPRCPLWRPLRPCSVSISSWFGNFTNSLHNVTCSHCLNCTTAGLHRYTVFMNAAITITSTDQCSCCVTSCHKFDLVALVSCYQRSYDLHNPHLPL